MNGVDHTHTHTDTGLCEKKSCLSEFSPLLLPVYLGSQKHSLPATPLELSSPRLTR